MILFFLMIRRPPRSTLDRSSAASDVYKRQLEVAVPVGEARAAELGLAEAEPLDERAHRPVEEAVSYTHLRAHETVLDLVCSLLLEKTTDQHQLRSTPPCLIYHHMA